MTLVSFVSRWLPSTGFRVCRLAARAQPPVFGRSDDLAVGLMKVRKQPRGNSPSTWQDSRSAGTRFKQSVAACAVLICCSAQGFTYNMPMPGPDLFVGSMIIQRAMQKKLVSEPAVDSRQGQAQQPIAPLAAALRASGDANVPRSMARTYPPAQRAQAERLFVELLAKYSLLAQQLRQPPDDLGTAVAALLAASSMVYRDARFPDAHFAPLAEQVRTVLRSSADIMNATPLQRREMLEEAAVLAMFMAGAQQAVAAAPSPAQAREVAARLRGSAQAHLERLAGVSADRVQISAQGLVIQPR